MSMGSKNFKMTGSATANTANRRRVGCFENLEMARNETAVTAVRIPTSVLAVPTSSIAQVFKESKNWKRSERGTVKTVRRFLSAVLTVPKLEFFKFLRAEISSFSLRSVKYGN
jgi:hypothetical protein